ERLPERIREEADEDVAFDSIVAMVPDRPDAKLRLLNPEGCFHVRELDVRPPELFGRPIRDVRPEDVRAFRELSPLRPFRPRSPDEPEPRAPRRVVPQIDLVLPGGSAVPLEDSSDLPVDRAALERLLRRVDASLEARKALLDARAEALVHRRLLLLTVVGATEDEGLPPVGRRAQLHLQAGPDGLPAALLDEIVRPLPEFALRRPDQVGAAPFSHPLQVLFTRHAAVPDPDPAHLPVLSLHRLDDFLDRRDVVAVAGEDLVTDGVPLSSRDERDTDLLAVRPLVSAVASLRLLDAVGRSLEVRRRHVVEEQVVLEIEEVAQALSQVLLQRLLQPEKLVHSAVEPHVVDKVGRDAEDVLERGFVVPGLGCYRLAGGFAHAGGREDSDHVAPRDALPALRPFLVEEPVELERLPERVNEPDVAESP